MGGQLFRIVLMPHLTVGGAETVALAVTLAIHHAGVGFSGEDLVLAFLQGGGFVAFQFVFPADQPAVREQAAQLADHFRCGTQDNFNFGDVAGDFFVVEDAVLAVLYLVDLEIGQGRSVQDREMIFL